jgi:hypothetical protein
MSWSERIYLYCERGSDPAFWAEPLNAVTNAAFLVAALLAGVEAARRPGGVGFLGWLLVLLVGVIGIGSFLFHTFAARWSELADVIPIGLFMLAYVVAVFRGFGGFGFFGTSLGLAAFLALSITANNVRCTQGPFDFHFGAGQMCLNGTMAYMPAFLMMVVLGVVELLKRRDAGRYLLAAAGVFAVSMTLRTLDRSMCPDLIVAGYRTGSHFVWHVLNALTLYLLLIAYIRHGVRR